MKTDPYFATQDNGAGAPLHFAVTYKQLDMIAHLLDLGAEINQQDDKVSFRARGTSLGGRVCIWRAVRILMVVFGRRRFFDCRRLGRRRCARRLNQSHHRANEQIAGRQIDKVLTHDPPVGSSLHPFTLACRA